MPALRRIRENRSLGKTMLEDSKRGDANKFRPVAPAHNVVSKTAPAAKSADGVVVYLLPASSGPGKRPIGGWSKRALDVALAAAAIVVLAPLMAVIAIAVRLDSPGPSFFRQERGGFGGKTFRIWKFRTMTVTENHDIVQARANDARVTALGSFLRRSSLDELPQVLNVLSGEMSVVGPRPHALEHDVQFEEVDARYKMRFCARPGVTGLAQVSGCRGPTDTDDKIRARTSYDLDYISRWSWSMELSILSRTVALLWKSDPAAF